MRYFIITLSFVCIVFVGVAIIGFFIEQNKNLQVSNSNTATSTDIQASSTISSVGTTTTSPISTEQSTSTVQNQSVSEQDYLYDNFNGTLVLSEVGSPAKSKNQYWWVNSGAYLFVNNGVGSTIQGSLATSSPWQVDYKNYSPGETDGGFYPQNIFRLVHLYKIKDFTQQAYFIINKDNLSANPSRAGSNGLFFFNRYQDGDNIYYTGIRVDGYAVIKKKYKGVYYTMSLSALPTADILSGIYNRITNPDLLPHDEWIGLRSKVTTRVDGSVSIQLYADMGKTGNWELVTSAIDDGKSFGGPVIEDAGYTGIRTDFMDVEFDDYKLTPLSEN